MAREKICGIYCIENLVNGKKYIGQSIDIYARWLAHKWKLNNSCHNNLHLMKAWKKYGEGNFAFTIIEECNRHELDKKEVSWIKTLQTRQNGYNLTDGGGGCLGRLYTEQQIKDKCYAILQLDPNGNFVNKWDRSSDAAEALNICCRSIQSAAGPDKKRKTAGGFIWVYEKDYGDFSIKNHKDSKKSPVRQYRLDWTYVRSYESIALAGEEGYHVSRISAVCRGLCKQAYGYIWVYDDIDIDSYIVWYNDYFDIKYIGQYDLQGSLIKIWNCAEDTRIDGFSPVMVRANIRGKYKTHFGYIFKEISWRYYELLQGEDKNGK